MKRPLASPLAPSLLTLLLCAVPAGAAEITVHATDADFLSAVTPGSLSLATFDDFLLGTVIDDEYPGVFFSSPNSGLPHYVPIRIIDAPQAPSEPYSLAGGTVTGGTVRPQMMLDFDSAPTALAFFLIADGSGVQNVVVRLDFADGTSQTLGIIPDPVEGTQVFFFGVTSDSAINRATLTSDAGSDGFFPDYGSIDNLQWGPGDILPPLCVGLPMEVDGVLGVDGTGTDDRQGDTGILSVELGPGSMNLVLTVDPFDDGDPSATFRVEAGDLDLDAQGTVLVTDGAGNSCNLCLNFKNIPPGPTFEEVLCCADGIAFFVSNDNLTDAGPAVCSSDPLGAGQPPLPPGYEPSVLDDPVPCTVFTINSPIAGFTEMTLKKDGDFDPRLRLMFAESQDGGLTYGPFEDVTELVEPILDVDPDPTKITGRKTWSPVKVACAIQAEICNGIDDDGDGEIDEGLPVGEPPVDHDQDGFFLCDPDPLLVDCNDQIASVNPGGVEVCNGLDDDCDGTFDDNNPGGGLECEVPGQLGACAVGITDCIEATIECLQTVEPTDEVCDGIDNDCDGEVDEGVAAPAAQCSLSPSTLNVDSQSTSFQVSVSNLVDACDTANPVPLGGADLSRAWISRAGTTVLPDPFGQTCPDPVLGSLFEAGIVENLDDRQVTGNDINLKFNLEADGECGTLDGSRQELFAILSDVPDGTILPVCITSSVNGVPFECCSDVKVRNSGNR